MDVTDAASIDHHSELRRAEFDRIVVSNAASS
jgi:hypothetical protein